MLTAALFELDGVLVDVAPARAESLLTAFTAEGISRDRAPQGSFDWLAPFDDLAAALAPGAADATTLALVALRAERAYAARIAAGVTLAPGAHDAVAAIASEWRVAVVTNWRRADADHVLALAGLDAHVRFVAAADDGPPFATPAVRVARALARLRGPGAQPSIVAALLASPAALAAARAAGARTVRLSSLHGLTPARLAAALDARPPRSPSHPSPR